MTTTTSMTTTTTTTAPTLPATMSAIVATGDGDHGIGRDTVEVPRPGPGMVLVAVRAFSVNRGELALLRHRDQGWRPGQDIAGDVVAIGPDVTDIAIGDRVAALIDGAGWAQYALAPAARIAVVPDGISYPRAAALPMAGTTALGLVRRGGSLLGRRALVSGASGGVGGFAVQLLARAGAHVTALARPSHAEDLRQLGAAEVVASLTEDPIPPVDFVLESVGGQTLSDAIGCIAVGGTVVTFGNSCGEPTMIDIFAFAGGHEGARVETYFSYQHEDQAGSSLTTLLDLAARDQLRIRIGRQEPWERTAEVIEALVRRQVSGKAVLTVT